MVSNLINLAEATAAFLSDQEFLEGLTITAERRFVSTVTIDDLEVDQYILRVVPTSRVRTRIGRSAWENSPTISVGVYRKLPADEAAKDASADEAAALVEQIENLLADRVMEFNGHEAVPESVVIDPIFGQEPFKDSGTFVSIINVKYTLNV